MTASDLPNKDETDLQMQRRIAELEKANKDLRAEILECKKADETLSRDRNLLESVMQTTDFMLAFFLIPNSTLCGSTPPMPNRAI
ncbi:mediator of RNA polymerase II transcription subunit 21 [Methanosarcina horonobensis]|uniref:hypothetical protein n=1 Tax=Methanosarcina horonobensis TaxID=418008 RepID=UPI000AA19933|nr:hypothetical protein [Methanosarcina horonobensis]